MGSCLQLHDVTGQISKSHCTLSADQKRDSEFNLKPATLMSHRCNWCTIMNIDVMMS